MSNTPETVILISGLRQPDTLIGRAVNKLSDKAAQRATRTLQNDGVRVVQKVIDFRPGAPDIAEQRHTLEEEARALGTSAIIGSSAGGQEALRLAHKLGIRGVSNQGRLSAGTNEVPTLDDAAKHHPAFKEAVIDFEDNVAPEIAANQNFLTIGAEHDSVVPRNLKKTHQVRHIEVEKPRGVPGLLSKVPGLNHGLAINRGLRDPEVRAHIKRPTQ